MDQASPTVTREYNPKNKDIFWLLFSTKGRIGRGLYAVVAIPHILTLFVAGQFIDMDENALFFMLFSIPYFWIGIAITAKRMHDLNLSYWHILKTFIPIAGMFFSAYYCGALFGKKGDDAPNEFGERSKIVL